MFELKSELLRKREQLKDSSDSPKSKKRKTLSLKGGISNKSVSERALKDDYDFGGKNEKDREKIMRQKAELYESLAAGHHLDDIPADEIMVDFERKYADKLQNELLKVEEEDTEDKMLEMEDEFGRKRLVPKSKARDILGIAVNLEDDFKVYKESEKLGYHMYPPVAMSYYAKSSGQFRQADIERESQAKDEWREITMRTQESIAEHYDPSSERRTLGTSFYKFSKDEAIRSNEMATLKEISKETNESRKIIDNERDSRKTRMKERIEKIKQRKKEISKAIDNGNTAVQDTEVVEFLESLENLNNKS